MRVEHFDKVATTPLDEWISFLKTGDIPVTATAPGLQEARERLRVDRLSEEERNDYDRMMENLRYQRSVIETGRVEGRMEGRAEGELSKAKVIATNLKSMGLPINQIVTATGLTEAQIAEL